MKHFSFAHAFVSEDLVNVEAFDIPVLADVGEIGIGHADLFALIYIRGAAQTVDGGREHLGGLFRIIFVIAEA